MKSLIHRKNGAAVLACLALLFVAMAVGPATDLLAGATVEGRWRLVEQRYGAGSANLPAPEAPVRLEFVAEQGRMVGRFWAGADGSKALPWPSFVSDQGPLPVEVREMAVAPGGVRARAVYRVKLNPKEDEVLELTEDYQLIEGGRILAGTVTITSLGKGGDSHGSYTLHRRFERSR